MFRIVSRLIRTGARMFRIVTMIDRIVIRMVKPVTRMDWIVTSTQVYSYAPTVLAK